MLRLNQTKILKSLNMGTQGLNTLKTKLAKVPWSKLTIQLFYDVRK